MGEMRLKYFLYPTAWKDHMCQYLATCDSQTISFALFDIAWLSCARAAVCDVHHVCLNPLRSARQAGSHAGDLPTLELALEDIVTSWCDDGEHGGDDLGLPLDEGVDAE